jgi:hypothetical protein
MGVGSDPISFIQCMLKCNGTNGSLK